MRKFINIVNEAPIVGWEAAPDMATQEAKMVSKFQGYDKEQLHFNPADKRAIRAPANIKQAFANVPYRFSIYFWQMAQPDYDAFLSRGLVDSEFLAHHGIDAPYREDCINIVMTNNMSDEYKIALTSPWMVAHRISHALAGNNDKYYQVFITFCEKLCRVAYGHKWPKGDDHFTSLIRTDYEECYLRIFSNHLGTMRSARENEMVNGYEWVHECFAQFLMTGRVETAPLPERISSDEVLTQDPAELAKAHALTAEFRKGTVRFFDRTLRSAVGKTFMV